MARVGQQRHRKNKYFIASNDNHYETIFKDENTN